MTIAKNYLTEEELKKPSLIVTQYLEFDRFDQQRSQLEDAQAGAAFEGVNQLEQQARKLRIRVWNGAWGRPPKATAVRGFLERFHDAKLEALRPSREEQKSFIVPSSEAVQGLQNVQAGAVRRMAQRYAEQGQAQRIATIDQDATIIESHKAAAQARTL